MIWYLLIISSLSGNAWGTVVTQAGPFDTRDACTKAMMEIKASAEHRIPRMVCVTIDGDPNKPGRK